MDSKFKITQKELIKVADYKPKDFPKYSASLINLLNRWAHGTDSKVVGQMSDLAIQCPHKEYGEWKKWYLEKYPNSIEKGANLIMDKLKEVKPAIDNLNKEIVKLWVEDLVIDKSFWGIKIQEAILLRIASESGVNCRLANKEEERKGIDGFIGDLPVQIKPVSYKTASNVKTETLRAKTVYYEKDKERKHYKIDASEIADFI